MAPARRRRSSRSPGPAASVTREHELPADAANDLIANFKGRLHSVKTQELKLEDKSTIIIARCKVPVPRGVSGHIIRRFDTDAVSATSLFKVAYPTATEDAELKEMEYLNKRYNTKQAGDVDDSGAGKLTGVWVPIEDAATIANDYGISKFVEALIAFEQPDGPSNGAISSPAAPTPKKAKSPAPTSARSKRARVASPPVSTRSSTSTMQSLTAATTPSKPSSKRITRASQEPETGGIQITQEVVVNEATGETTEETKITFTGKDGEAALGASGEDGLIGSDEQARKAVEDARKLIESLKSEGVLQSNGATTKRAFVDEEQEEREAEAAADASEEKRGLFGRMFGRKKPSKRRTAQRELGELQVLQSPDGAQVLVAQAPPPQPAANRRRYIAMAGMVVMGAATAAAPYIFG